MDTHLPSSRLEAVSQLFRQRDGGGYARRDAKMWPAASGYVMLFGAAGDGSEEVVCVRWLKG